MSTFDPIEFGRLQAQVKALLDSDKEKTDLLRGMAEEVKAMRLQMAEAKGGWKVLMFLGGSAATAGAGLGAWLTQFLQHGPKP